jgi:hypothetical protein
MIGLPWRDDRMDGTAREQLAQRLSALSFKDAQKEIRALDPDADMKYFRNAMWHEYHTLFTLPNAGLSVALVEKEQLEESRHRIGGGPRGLRAEKAAFTYTEARVEPLTRPAHKRGSTGPAPLLQLARERAAQPGDEE